MGSVAKQERVADDLRLLLEPVSGEWPSRHDLVPIMAKWVAHQRKIKSAAFLSLPNVGHFVDEKPLSVPLRPGEILGPATAVRMEVNIAHRRHCGAWRLERPPFPEHQPDLRIIDRVAEHGPRQRDFAWGQGA